MEKYKNLIGNSVFDTARNVYFMLLLTKELKQDIDPNSIHQIKSLEISDKGLAKLVFGAFVDCPKEEQLNLLRLLFQYYKETGNAHLSIAHAFNDLKLWPI